MAAQTGKRRSVQEMVPKSPSGGWWVLPCVPVRDLTHRKAPGLAPTAQRVADGDQCPRADVFGDTEHLPHLALAEAVNGRQRRAETEGAGGEEEVLHAAVHRRGREL